MIEAGDLNIPVLLDELLEVFVDSEKICSNNSKELINNQFSNLPHQENQNDAQQVQITMKSDLNSNICQWKHMAKSVCDYIKT